MNLPNKPKFEIASNKKFKLYNTYISTKNSASSSDVSVDEISINKNQLVSSQPELENDEGSKIISLNNFYNHNYFINIVSNLQLLYYYFSF